MNKEKILPASIVIIPTYNEKENIREMLSKVFTLPVRFHVLIVDDNSPDGTADIIRQIQKDHADRLFLESRAGKMGLGTAYIHGFQWALKNGYDYIFEMDADFSHNPEDLPRLLEACIEDGADLSVGSRYCRGGKVQNWPMSRVMLSYFASLYVRFITWMPVTDTTAGFVCYSRKVLESIDLSKIRFVGYAFQIEMKYAAWKLGFSTKEVPIIFTDRVKGKSKMSMKIFKEAFTGVFIIRFTGNQKRYSKA